MSVPRPWSLISELPAPRLRPEVLLKGSVLQAQCLSFALDKLTVMSKVAHTISAQAHKGQWLLAAAKALGDFPSTKGHFFSACIGSLDRDRGPCLDYHESIYVPMYALPKFKRNSNNSDKCDVSTALIFPPQFLNTVLTPGGFFVLGTCLTTSTFFTPSERIQAVEPYTLGGSAPMRKHWWKKPGGLQAPEQIDPKFDQKRQTVSYQCFLGLIVSPERSKFKTLN